MKANKQNPTMIGKIYGRTLRDIHRDSHRTTLELARKYRHDGAEHAALLNHAKRCRFFFEQVFGLE